MGIVRPVMEVYPWSWMFFIPFIACTTFTVLNLFIGVVVSAMQAEHDELAAQEREIAQNEQTLMAEEMARLRAEMQALRESLVGANRTG